VEGKVDRTAGTVCAPGRIKTPTRKGR